MPLRNTRPFTFRAKGLSDTVDGSNVFAGAMQSLQNLIPAQDTSELWVPRPAAALLTDFSGFTAPGFVSSSLVVGNIEYGLVSSGLNAGRDQPYAYNLETGLFLAVTGITAANTPSSPPSIGAWTPPIMTLVGTSVIVTHPGFPGGAIKFGWFDISSFTTTQSITTTSGSPDFTSTSDLLQDGVQPGQTITSGDFPAGTTVVSINAAGTAGVASANATGSATANATFAGGTPASPQWGAGDTNIYGLPSVPVAVAQFNGRAYFACGSSTPYTDSLLPRNRTNADQALSFGNGLPVTALEIGRASCRERV